MTALAQAADIVLPGASWVEKDGAFVNGQGRLQAASRAIAPPGDAQEDWQVFVNVGLALGAPLTYTSSAAVRGDLAAALAGNERYAGLATLAFARPVVGAALAAGVEPVGAMEVGLHVPGSAAGQIRGDAETERSAVHPHTASRIARRRAGEAP